MSYLCIVKVDGAKKRTQNPQKNTEAFAQMSPDKTKDTEIRAPNFVNFV